MIKSIPPSTATPSVAPALQNRAVACCDRAWQSTRLASLAKGKSEGYACVEANKAYCAAMPPLSGHDNISDFIACVGYGLLVEIIRQQAAACLLHAARTALGALPKTAPQKSDSSPLEKLGISSKSLEINTLHP